MDTYRWDQLSALFKRAVSLPRDARRALLEEACANDPELRREVEELLEINAQSGITDDLEGPLKASLASLMQDEAIHEGQILSHFQIVGPLGRGGMGHVYKARDMGLDRMVALKFLPPHLSLDEEARLRFIREAKAASALDHANICTIYEIGETQDGQTFIAMACYEGETLKAKIARGPLPMREAVDYALQVSEGLAQAHEAGIVHRDVKPANVMVTPRGRVKLLDFGIAKVRDEVLTKTGATVGTVAYMSPEQARGEEVDARTDIWSLGVVLYEMLSGARPFAGEYEAAVLYELVNVVPVPVEQIRPETPEGLAQLVARALEKDAAHRFSDMQEMAVALQGIRKDKAVARQPAGASSESSGALPSIAVLPFVDMSPEKDQDYFCEGVAEELLNALARLQGLRVASRTSAFQFKGRVVDIREVGDRLNVNTVLEGSVRKAGNRLRVTVQLINAEDGYQLWSERYDRELEDIFAVQDEIAEHAVQALQGILTEADRQALQRTPATDIEAYDYFLRGRQFLYQLTRSGLDFARRLFNRAVEIDPDYAPAHAAIAFSSYLLYQWYGQSKTDRKEADRASWRAVELAPDLPEPHVARGLALTLNKQFEEAEEAMETALRINPDHYDANYFFGRLCFIQGKLEPAARLLKRSTDLDPQEYQAAGLLSGVYQSLGRLDEAIVQKREGLSRVQRRLELNPDDVRAVYIGALMLLQLGEREEGLAWIQRAYTMAPDDPVVVWNMACAYALAGEPETALDYLEQAVELGIANRGWVENDSDMDALRDHPRYKDLLERMEAKS